MSAIKYWLWLAQRPNCNVRTAQMLLSHFGMPEMIWSADLKQLRSVPFLQKAQLQSLSDKNLDGAERLLALCNQKGISIVTQADSLYPDRLRNIEAPPTVLYVKGRLPDMDDELGVAIVGTRNATAYGLSVSFNMAERLAGSGCVIVSGMALGIDGAANAGALKARGTTIAVLGCGLDICYPAEHRRLMDDIAATGAVISEYPPGTAPDRKNFPARNRIISGLAMSTLVVEAPLRSGSLITANYALEQGRELFAVPGNIDAPNSQGTNRLIAQGAYLASCPWDILIHYKGFLKQKLNEEYMKEAIQTEHKAEIRTAEKAKSIWARFNHKKEEKVVKSSGDNSNNSVPENLSDEELAILSAVGQGAGSPDEIIEKTNFPAARVMATITILEINGRLKRENGRISAI